MDKEIFLDAIGEKFLEPLSSSKTPPPNMRHRNLKFRELEKDPYAGLITYLRGSIEKRTDVQDKFRKLLAKKGKFDDRYPDRTAKINKRSTPYQFQLKKL